MGTEALQIVAELDEPIDLLLTDVTMPGLSGPDLYQRLRQSRPRLKALFMSGYTDVMEHDPLDERIPFLQKPFSPDTLTGMVREALDQGRGADEARQTAE